MEDDSIAFLANRKFRISENAKSPSLQKASHQFLLESLRSRYSYNFDWLGRPIIQYPQDIVALQEIVWNVQPDLIIETGVARGGSLIFSASLLALLDYCEAVREGTLLDPGKPRRRVLGVDIDIRPHNRAAIERHPLSSHIEMIQGSSVDPAIVSLVKAVAQRHRKVLVCLDSNHTGEHVLAELSAYAPLVGKGSYCIVFDTVISDVPDELFNDRPWTRTNSPRSAIEAFLATLATKEILAHDGEILALAPDVDIDSKLLITVAPHGYLRRT